MGSALDLSDIINTDRDLDLDAYIRRVVESAPPLTPDALDRIRALLPPVPLPGDQEDGGADAA